jgi:hypothetical protein
MNCIQYDTGHNIRRRAKRAIHQYAGAFEEKSKLFVCGECDDTL